ncbi:hydantoinase/oxoprolinase family protein [Glycomyces dulcitolivorans]|uniref:hydantoinase/oxoprolinase family protein n=1 Tax=Glycomyces dulcitolivorans TaxID=2200759 RepID=UPI000DD3C2D1|nr:hydantoinase/oxoprolinase family protein [Glycomyces dulcitolivorans]
MAIRIGVDTGGTFTDVVAFDEATGTLRATKTPSTPDDPSRGFAAGLDRILPAGQRAAAVAHGTTVATNQLLEDRVGDLGFITTEGFESILEIARQSVPDGYGNSYFWVKPPRIVPAHRVKTVGGRLDHRGTEVRPFDEDGARAAAVWMRDNGIETIGVCFLHAYANPGHERRMREILAEEHPGACVSVSSEVLREYREYERSVTTLVDAAVKPTVRRYIARIAARLEERADAFYIMKSNGGVLSAAEVVEQPIATVLSGPAAGVLGATLIAADAVTLDGGGTSTDVAVVQGGEPALTTEGTVGRYPSKIPMIDVVTVGAGGGSIAWTSPEGTLKVGPRSAGADPGPMCYPKGGSEPTVTDAHVLLGRIPPALLGGEIKLDPDTAAAGIGGLATRLGLGLERTAEGILEISAWNQANAIRQVTVQRGIDVRTLPLVAFGGSGPLLACRLIDLLGMRAAIIPRDPGSLSAFGLLTVDVRNDYVRTCTGGDPGDLYAELEALAVAGLDRERIAPSARSLHRSADLRYPGQSYEVRVPAPAGDLDSASFNPAAVETAFHEAHQRLYGYATPDKAPEWVNVRVTGVGAIPKPALPAQDPGEGAMPFATRNVHFGTWQEAAIYRREDLGAGDLVEGPAIVEEFGSTTPIEPGFTARVDALGSLVVTR